MNILSLFGITRENLAIIFIIGVVLFFIFREIFTWYLKTTKIVTLLEKIEENTRPKSAQKSVEVVSEPKPSPVPTNEQANKPQRTALDKWWNGPDTQA